MFNELSGKVIGQDEALSKIVKAIQRAKMGMKDLNRPLLTSLMVGDSGVGKTHMAKELAKYIEMRKGEFSIGDAVKIVSGSKDHLGRIGYIAKILNNGKEDYYEVRMGDMGIDLCFPNDIKKINNPNTIAAINNEPDVEEKPIVKADEEPKHQVGIVAAFEKMKEDLLKRIELEDGQF
jgi:ATP-dependent protease Clp ATPase subunit